MLSNICLKGILFINGIIKFGLKKNYSSTWTITRFSWRIYSSFYAFLYCLSNAHNHIYPRPKGIHRGGGKGGSTSLEFRAITLFESETESKEHKKISFLFFSASFIWRRDKVELARWLDFMCTFKVSYTYAWYPRSQMFWIYSSNFV